eukprot:scaffold33751_cov23-Cyclotella_meneghiniana.AAC.1
MASTTGDRGANRQEGRRSDNQPMGREASRQTHIIERRTTDAEASSKDTTINRRFDAAGDASRQTRIIERRTTDAEASSKDYWRQRRQSTEDSTRGMPRGNERRATEARQSHCRSNN